MRSIEATAAFEPLLAEIASGEPVEIRRGTIALAIVYPASETRPNREQIRQTVDDLKRLRKGVTLGGLKVKDLVNEGRP